MSMEQVAQSIKDEFFKQPVFVGRCYEHPEEGVIEIVSGAYWVDGRLSNFWQWRNVETGVPGHGYGGDWPEVSRG